MSHDARRDLEAAPAVKEARREYALTGRLGRLDEAVAAPVGRYKGCLIKPHLAGPDLRRMARVHGNTPAVQSALEEGAALAGHLHRHPCGAIPGLKPYDYLTDVFLRPSADVAARMAIRSRTVVISSFVVGNFRAETPHGPWKFFDPHLVRLGFPEDDIARYVLSLLMINWGRKHCCWIWTCFDLAGLLRAYEQARGEPVDHDLLPYMFRRSLAARRVHCRGTVDGMPTVQRAAGQLYYALYFAQLEAWIERHMDKAGGR